MLSLNLKNARQEIGLSQEDVAKELGISQPAYSYFESGLKCPSVPVLVQLSKILNKSMDELVK